MRFGHFCLPTYYPESDGTPGEHMRRLVDYMASSEELGFDAVWANEHHFHAYGGLIPSPAVFLSAVAQRTSHVRLGTSVIVMPLHNPLEIAEQLAMVDLMSGGRVEIGVGRGFVLHDYEVLGVPLDEGQERTIEGLDVVLKAWSGKPFSHEGKYFRYDNLDVWPAPQQRPHPPVWFACSNNPDSFEWTARHGYKVLTVAHIKPLNKLAALTQLYRDAWRNSGRDPADCDVCTHFQVVVGESKREAVELAKRSMERYYWINKQAQSLASKAEAQAQASSIEDVHIEQLVDEGRLIAGDPAQCVELLKRAQDEVGMTVVDASFYFGGMTYEQAQRSIRLFGTEVIPALRNRTLQEVTA